MKEKTNDGKRTWYNKDWTGGLGIKTGSMKSGIIGSCKGGLVTRKGDNVKWTKDRARKRELVHDKATVFIIFILSFLYSCFTCIYILCW